MIVVFSYLFLSIFGGGSALKALSERVEKEIQDPQRVERVQDLIDQVTSVLEGYEDDLDELTDRIVLLNQDYGSTVEQYDSLQEELQAAQTETRARILDLRFQMKDEMTREEWEAVFPAQE